MSDGDFDENFDDDYVEPAEPAVPRKRRRRLTSIFSRHVGTKAAIPTLPGFSLDADAGRPAFSIETLVAMHGARVVTTLRTRWYGMFSATRGRRSMVLGKQSEQARADRKHLTKQQQRRRRGCAICAKWHDFHEFLFWSIEAGFKLGMTLVRKNPEVGWNPDNCMWQECTSVPRRNEHVVEAFGETRRLSEWARDPRCKVSLTVARIRINTGWDAERALTTPKQKVGRPKGGSHVAKHDATKSAE